MSLSFPALAVCWPWDLRMLAPDDHQTGAQCAFCRRAIAAPSAARRAACLYCAIDRGIVDAVDRPFGDDPG